MQWLARRPGARGWLVVAPEKLGEPTPYGTVAEQVARAEAAGADVRRAGTGTVSVHVAAAVTTTLGGLAIDAQRPRGRRRLGGRRRRRRDRRGRLRERARRRARDWAGSPRRRRSRADGARAVRTRVGEPFRIGIEDELFLLDARRARSRRSPQSVLPRLDAARGPRGPRAVRRRARAALAAARAPPPTPSRRCARGRAAVAAAGATPMAAGLHPGPSAASTAHVDLPRYERVGGEMRGLLRRTPECALHVHVGMPDPETAIRVANGLRTHLPLLAGLAANSPFWFGVDSGLAQRPLRARALLPRPRRPARLPRLRRLRALARDDAARRRHGGPHAAVVGRAPARRARDVEVREMDAQTELRDVLPLAALVHCLARYEAERGSPLDHPPRRARLVDLPRRARRHRRRDPRRGRPRAPAARGRAHAALAAR